MKKILTICAVCVILITAIVVPCSAITIGEPIYQYYIPFDYVKITDGGGNVYVYELPTSYSAVTQDESASLYYENDTLIHHYGQEFYMATNGSYRTLLEGTVRNINDISHIESAEFYAKSMVLDEKILTSNVTMQLSATDGYVDKITMSYASAVGVGDRTKTATQVTIDGGVAVDMMIGKELLNQSNTNTAEVNLPLYERYKELKREYDREWFVLTNITVKIDFGKGGGGSLNMRDFSYSVTSPTTNVNLIDAIADSFTYQEVVNIYPENIDFEDVNFIEWIAHNVNSFMTIEFIPGISIGSILWVVIGVAFTFFLLKVFMGG